MEHQSAFEKALTLYLIILFETEPVPMETVDSLQRVVHGVGTKTILRNVCPDFECLVGLLFILVQTGLYASGKGRKLYKQLGRKIEQVAPPEFRKGLDDFFLIVKGGGAQNVNSF